MPIRLRHLTRQEFLDVADKDIVPLAIVGDFNYPPQSLEAYITIPEKSGKFPDLFEQSKGELRELIIEKIYVVSSAAEFNHGGLVVALYEGEFYLAKYDPELEATSWPVVGYYKCFISEDRLHNPDLTIPLVY